MKGLHKAMAACVGMFAAGLYSSVLAADPATVVLSGNRFQPVPYAQISEPQQKLLQGVLSSDWPDTAQPLNVLLSSPEAGLIIRDIGAQLRNHSGLTNSQRDMVILMVVRAWTAQRAWAEYQADASADGLSPKMIAALAAEKKPAGLSAQDEVVWRIADELLYHRMLSDRTFADGRALLGEEKLVNVSMLVPYYELLCMLEQLDDSQLPAHQKAALKTLRVAITPLAKGALGPIPSFPALQEGEGPTTGEFKVVGGRLAPLKWSEMTEDQKQLADRLINSWRHSVSSVFISMIRSPKLGLIYENLGSLLNPRTAPMDVRIRNFATLLETRHWNAHFEYWAAHRNAVRAGVSEQQVAAVTAGKRPENMDAKLAAAYDLCMQLINERRVSPQVYQTAIAQLGTRDTVGAVIMVGFYGMVAAQTEALLRYPMPEGMRDELAEPAH